MQIHEAGRGSGGPRSGRPPRRAASAGVLAGVLAAALLVGCDSAEERVQSHHARGLALAAAGEPGKALIEFTNALRIDRTFIPAHLELGRLHVVAGRLPRAAGHFEAVLEADPDDVETRLALARVHLDLRDVDRALVQADALLERVPDDPRALGLRASIDLLTGDDAAAARRAAAALAIDPGATLARLALAAERVRADDLPAALALLEAAPGFEAGRGFGSPADAGADAVPDPAAASDAMALELIRIQVLERMGDRARVGAALQRLADRDPAAEEMRLALVAWRLRGDPPDLDGAEADLRALADLRPGAPEPRLRVVDFLRQTRGEPAARAELERLIAPPTREPTRAPPPRPTSARWRWPRCAPAIARRPWPGWRPSRRARAPPTPATPRACCWRG
jgi:cellulose synthase operon protein C